MTWKAFPVLDWFVGKGYKGRMSGPHPLTPITCNKCGKPATFEFLYQDQRMCVMCYKEAMRGVPAAALPLTEEEKTALADLLGEAGPGIPGNT